MSPAPVGEAVERIDALWIVVSPRGVPQPHTCRDTREGAMAACFGRREHDRYPQDWWQHNLDEGWTCREIAFRPAAGEADGLAEVEREFARFEGRLIEAYRAGGHWPGLEAMQAGRQRVLDAMRALAARLPAAADAASGAGGDRWIDQTRTRDTHPDVRGDCTRAAIASLFALPLDAVPDFDADDPVAFYEGVEAFFLSLGYEMVRLDGDVALDAMHLANGPAARGVPHTVVRRGSAIVHDPHPSRAGLDGVDFVVVPVPLDPSRPTADRMGALL